MLIATDVILGQTDMLYSGLNSNSSLSISGTVAELGNLKSCRVRLYDKRTGAYLKELLALNGKYKFTNLSNAAFFIVAHHPSNQYNAVIQDNVVPK